MPQERHCVRHWSKSPTPLAIHIVEAGKTPGSNGFDSNAVPEDRFHPVNSWKNSSVINRDQHDMWNVVNTHVMSELFPSKID
ncbi:hypothetical protein T265_08589 [Opisthorchis viverrini]|uniref:Uncharacterized protein n=1 Tax=Opisthorchis viverrini TaxID=6198 RepID=A0A074Z8U0_OPIVI|nr:hypothetical protein T265_08589 [Opisthorchis viverrini]KER23548.1 hypothetical protein T265_08589 [Opisthorchis viverrini]